MPKSQPHITSLPLEQKGKILMRSAFILLFLICCLCLSVSAQVAPEAQTLVPGQPVEREIKGGQSHVYQLSLAAGQFVRLRLEQRANDAALILTAPDGKQLAEMDMTYAGEQEMLSLEAVAPGAYRLTVRSEDAAARHGSYRLEATVQASASALDRKRLAAEALVLEGMVLHKQGPNTAQQATEKLEQALPMWRELQEPSWIAVSLGSIGDAYASAGQSEEALKYYELALATSREFKLQAREVVVLKALGQNCYRLTRYEKAIEYAEQALAIQRDLKDRAGEGDTLNSLGVVYNTMRRNDKAIENYEQALAIKRELKDRSGEAGTLSDVGWAYMAASRSQEALASFESALAIFREMKDRSRESGALSGLGMTNMSLSRFEKAIEFYEQALAINRELKDRASEGVTLTNLGGAYAALRRYDKYLEYAEQSLAINRETKSRFAEGRTLSDMGAVYLILTRYDKSLEVLEQALAINRETRDRLVEGFTLLYLGGISVKLGRPEKAIEYYEQSLAINREYKSRPHEASTLNKLGELYRSQRQYEKAIAYSEQSLAISREVKNPEFELNALSNLAWTESDRGNLARARTRVEEMLSVAESLRADVISSTSRASLLASVQGSYQLLTDILMRQHKAESAKGFDALAVEVSERQRARSLLDLLVEAGADLRQGVDPALIEREQTLTKRLNAKARQRTNTPEAAAALKLEISQLETEYERAQVAIRKASPHYAALVQPKPLKLKEIQAQLDADTLLLEYALGANRSYLWAITRDSLTSYELPKAEIVDQTARQVVELLTARSINKRGESAQQRQQRITQAEAGLPAAAQSLSQTLLMPVAAQLGNKRLVIVADGALQYIPFAMLPDPSVVSSPLSVARNNGPRTTDHGQPLIVNHEVVSLPSASALAIQRAELAGRQPAPKMLAVIADPVFDRSDSRFTTPMTETGDKTPTQNINGDDARSLEHLAGNPADKSGVTTLRLVIPRLPFTRQEATRVLALTPKNSSFAATDFQASRATVLSGNLSQYRYVHFATHGLLDSERPGLSSLVLSMVDAQGKPLDGFLRANDIYNLKLPAELVVLSACQTGLGKEIKGEGLVGLTRGFMYAGAARVVVSLWSVNDKATSDLMTKFYEKMLKQGERPAAALRAAQVEMWKQKQWQSPYYWAAFTMQGEWR
ncbi:MAG: CHAT domain-containing protein [Pyrinomonadaceae bacterium]|nr:CHAT domain-containing protein [Pyrinomonadaceae bacterium]